MNNYDQVINLFETSTQLDDIQQPSYINDSSVVRPSDWNSDEEEDGPWIYDELIQNPFNVVNINLLLVTAIEKVVLHPVKLEIIPNPNFHTDDPVDFDDNDLTEQDKLWCKNHSYLDSIIFPDINKIVAISEKKGNSDSRGGGCGCCGFDVEDFLWEETFTNGIKLLDLASVVYRLKGSKYDWWYELYDHVKFIIIDKTLFLNVVFEYVS